ncbi:fimbrial protein [Trabulsiella odontotermitis]|uniref:fimbrial protein n=1 Tax=Trabulsiella odontotermitis TaxID=379893 RepID=UPI003ACAC3E5
MKGKYWLIFLLASFWSAQSWAYLVSYDSEPQNCVRDGYNITANTTIRTSFTLNSSLLRSLGDNQYLMLDNPYYENNFSAVSYPKSFMKTCSNLGQPQSQITVRYLPEQGNSLIAINENSVVNLYNLGSKGIDDDKGGLLVRSSVQGLFFMLTERTNKSYPPISVVRKDDWKDVYIQGGVMIPVVNKQFRGIPTGTVVSTTPAQFTINVSDASETGSSAATQPITYGFYSGPMDVAITASCAYSLSDNGVVDFGSVASGEVTGSTGDRNSARQVKQLTLNMDDCYGVNKVKTTVTATNNTPVLENGLVLGNNETSGSQHVGVAIRVNPQYRNKDGSNDNAGKDLYFNSSNSLSWTFGNTTTVNAMSKNITLDVYLLPSGGAVTPGAYHGTATIMMDFV